MQSRVTDSAPAHSDRQHTRPPVSTSGIAVLSDARYRLLYEEASDSIFTLDTEGRIIAANPATEKLGGYSLDDWATMHFSEVLLPDSLETVQRAFAQLLRGEPIASLEYGMRTKDGRELYLSASLRPVIVDGRVVEVEGIARDITLLRAWAEQLAASEERYRILAEGARDVIWTADLDGTYTYVSQSAVELFGYQPEELIGKTYTTLLLPEDLERVATMLMEGYTGQRTDARVEMRLRRKDGSFVWCELDAAVTTDSAGRLIGMQGITRDISERKAAEETHRRLEAQLLHAQKMEAVGTLAGGIAHDFNNLLTGILGAVELALLDVSPGSAITGYLRQAQAAANRGSELTRHLLALSRKREPEFGSLDLRDVVGQTMELLGRSISQAIAITVACDPDLPAVRGDAGQLEQAILNLGINARDAMPDGGELTVNVTCVTLDADDAARDSNVRPGRFVRITVSDTGTGMPPQVVERIFEPFFTTKPQGQGTGLGLAMVYGCIQAHEGWVQVSSEPGRGSTFRLYLPVAGDAAPTATTSHGTIPSGTERLLLVDDTEAVLIAGREMLERCGYTVLTAANGDEALAALAEVNGAVDAIVTDLVMPRCSGRQLLQSVRQQGYTFPVILTSGYAMDATPAALIAEGFATFIEKPFNLQTIAAAVRQVLDAVAA